MRVRRMAARQGLALHRKRRFQPRTRGSALYWLRWVDAPEPETSYDAWVGYPGGFDIDQVEAYLFGDSIDPDVAAELERTGRN